MDPSGIHDSGLFTAMLITVTGIVFMLIWAFWFAFTERGATPRKEAMQESRESAEEALPRRFAQRDISEEPSRYGAPTQEEISAHRLQQWYDEIGRAAHRLRKKLPTGSTDHFRQARR